ncbi:MAG: ATP-dependent Clp protease proteolytic subunit [Phycisphaerales bacterium]|nr:ATP-dependent Clp protease proteolytic subunit [Phycisphaerales bacterium]
MILSRSEHPLGNAVRHDDDDDHDWVAVPLVVDKRGKSEELVDLYSRMLRDRVVFVGGAVSRPMAQVVTAQLLFLANEDPKAEVSMYVNSPGGSITDGLAIIDTMRSLPCPVATYIVGQAASMASVIACCGAKGRRFALRHAENLMHQGRIGGFEGQATDLEIFARQMQRIEDVCNRLYAEATGHPESKIAEDCDRDLWLDAQEMLAYGLIDRIIERMPEAPHIVRPGA